MQQIKKSIDVAQKAQRNYDLSKVIPESDLETLIYAAVNSPSKQNETHYSLRVYTDQKIIRQIYNQTKFFSLYKKNETEGLFEERNGKFWQNQDRSVHNSQILANSLFVYVDDEGEARGGTHMFGKNNPNKESDSYITYQEQKNFSIGISVGQLLLTATLIGLKTGLCSGFSREGVAKIINCEKSIKLLVGIGYDNIDVDRQLHAETLNKDVPTEFQTGDLDKKWRFPSFKKNIKVFLNDQLL